MSRVFNKRRGKLSAVGVRRRWSFSWDGFIRLHAVLCLPCDGSQGKKHASVGFSTETLEGGEGDGKAETLPKNYNQSFEKRRNH